MAQIIKYTTALRRALKRRAQVVGPEATKSFTPRQMQLMSGQLDERTGLPPARKPYERPVPKLSAANLNLDKLKPILEQLARQAHEADPDQAV